MLFRVIRVVRFYGRNWKHWAKLMNNKNRRLCKAKTCVFFQWHVSLLVLTITLFYLSCIEIRVCCIRWSFESFHRISLQLNGMKFRHHFSIVRAGLGIKYSPIALSAWHQSSVWMIASGASGFCTFKSFDLSLLSASTSHFSQLSNKIGVREAFPDALEPFKMFTIFQGSS